MNNSMAIPIYGDKVALVSSEDYERVVNEGRWHASESSGSWYVARRPSPTRVNGKVVPKVYLHRWLMDAPKGLVVDHIDGNGLNNQRDNLRLATHSQNHANHKSLKGRTTPFKGINKTPTGFRVTIKAEVGEYYLGTYATLEEAAIARELGVRKHHGGFGKTFLDIPDDTEMPTPLIIGRPNKIGLKGVSSNHHRFMANIWTGTKTGRIYIGTYDTPEEAYYSYCAAHLEIFGRKVSNTQKKLKYR